MKGLLLASGLLLSLAGIWGCGGDDDDDGGGGGGCAHVQMLCKDDPDAMIDCSEWDAAPASIKDCASKATTCDGVGACFIPGGG